MWHCQESGTERKEAECARRAAIPLDGGSSSTRHLSRIDKNRDSSTYKCTQQQSDGGKKGEF